MTGKMIGKIIKNARIEKGYSQDKLAEKLMINRSIISRLESEKHSPRVDTLDILAQGLGMALKIEFVDPSLAYIFTNLERISVSLADIESCKKSSLENIKPLNINDLLYQAKAPRIPPSHILCVWIWEYILNSGILEKNPEAIRFTVASDDEETIHDCAGSIIFLTEYIYEIDDIFNKPMKCGMKAIVESVVVERDSKHITINFAESSNKTEIIKKALEEEKKKIAESKEYYDEHPDGFEFLVYPIEDFTADYMMDVNSSYDIVIAATSKEALHKYINENKYDLMTNYYYNYFVEDFVSRLSKGFELKDFGDAKALEHLMSQAIEEPFAIDKIDEKISAHIVDMLTPDELYRVIGKKVFEKMWFDIEEQSYKVSLSKRQRVLLEYLF